MGIHMKTTVELPDALFVAAKKRAAEERTTLRTIFERALRHELSGKRTPAARPGYKKIRWVTYPGGLPEGLDMSDRVAMHEWLSKNR
jgi:hypothetical protein